jgi:hypothetical protein
MTRDELSDATFWLEDRTQAAGAEFAIPNSGLVHHRAARVTPPGIKGGYSASSYCAGQTRGVVTWTITGLPARRRRFNCLATLVFEVLIEGDVYKVDGKAFQRCIVR